MSQPTFHRSDSKCHIYINCLFWIRNDSLYSVSLKVLYLKFCKDFWSAFVYVSAVCSCYRCEARKTFTVPVCTVFVVSYWLKYSYMTSFHLVYRSCTMENRSTKLPWGAAQHIVCNIGLLHVEREARTN